jgi:hypothetical protein
MRSYRLQDELNKRLGGNSLIKRSNRHFRIPHDNGFIRYLIFSGEIMKHDFLFKNSSDLPFGGMMQYEGESIEYN